MKFSNRVINLNESPIRKLAPSSNKAISDGKKIYFLNIGQPDIQTPKSFFEAVKRQKIETLKYEPSQGNRKLIESIVSRFKEDDIIFDYKDIIVTNGASEALLFAISAITDPQDEILIPEPFYVNTVSILKQFSINVVPILTVEENNYHLPEIETIEKLINTRTKAILITNPNNPTGTVYSEEELKMIVKLALKYNLYIISDEVYRPMSFDNKKATSLATISRKANDNLILIDSVSKKYSACGARIGAIISKNERLMSHIIKLAQARLSVSTLDQVGATELYKLDSKYYIKISKEYQSRRDVVIRELEKIDGITYSYPEGAFYILVTLPIENAEYFAKWMLESYEYNGETVFVAPAKDFYLKSNKGINQIRIAYVYNKNKLKRALLILKKGLETYLKNF